MDVLLKDTTILTNSTMFQRTIVFHVRPKNVLCALPHPKMFVTNAEEIIEIWLTLANVSMDFMTISLWPTAQLGTVYPVKKISAPHVLPPN